MFGTHTTAAVMMKTFIIKTEEHEVNRLTHSLMADRLTSLPTVLHELLKGIEFEREAVGDLQGERGSLPNAGQAKKQIPEKDTLPGT